MKITATAPNRVDLAGGTLDIYPLYLFEEGGLTVNAAISIASTVTLETRNDAAIHVYSEDTNEELSAMSANALPLHGPLSLVSRIVRYYQPACGLNIITKNDAPKGSGLGASSALLIALSGALNHLGGQSLTERDLIRIGANLEAQCIGIPTGKQDYYAAMYGGVNALWFQVDKDDVEPLVVKEDAIVSLEQHMILSFTGQPHFSAVTNWGMLKSYIEKRGNTVDRLRAIKQTAFAMREALLQANIPLLAELLNQEWDNRRHLAEGVSTPEIEKIMQAAHSAGALASKICGAGGGGCMLTIASPDRRDQIIHAMTQEGAQILPATISRRGLEIQVD